MIDKRAYVGFFSQLLGELSGGDVKSLCEILANPADEIFTEPNVTAIKEYGTLNIGGRQYQVVSRLVNVALLRVYSGQLDKDDVLSETVKSLVVHKLEDRELDDQNPQAWDNMHLRALVYNHLYNQGYMQPPK